MIQNYQSLKLHLDEYNKSFSPSQDGTRQAFGQIQRAFSTNHFICLVIRYPGQTRYLYLGRGNSYEGAWEYDQTPPSSLRMRDRFLEYIRKHVVGSKIERIELDKQDRIIHLNLIGKERQAIFSLFWKGRQSYFTYVLKANNSVELFCSWEKGKTNFEPGESLSLIVEKKLNEIGRRELEEDKKAKPVEDLKRYFEKQVKNLTESPFAKRKRKFYQRKLSRIQADFEKVTRWNNLKNKIEEPSFQFSIESNQMIEGIKFKFPHQSSDYQKRDLVYKKIKAFKRAEEILKERQETCQREFESWQAGTLEKDGEETSPRGKVCSPVWANKAQAEDRNKKSHKTDSLSGVIEFDISLKNGARVKGGIGKDIHANDQLRSKWASKKHFWFHLEGMKSGHCILKIEDILNFEEEDFEAIGSLLRDFAKLEILEIPLVFTQVKNLRGVKGQAGAVLFKKARYRKVNYRNNWREIISLH